MFSYIDMQRLFTTYSSCPRGYGEQGCLVLILSWWTVD